MKKIVVLFLSAIMLLPAMAQQKSIDEEKVKKAVVLMQKMMTDPSQMQTVFTELEALKLNSAEDREAKKRIETAAIKQVEEIKKKGMSTGGITEKQITEFKENQDRIVPVKDNKRINAVLKRNLTDAEIKNYCKALFEAVKKEMNPAAVSQAEKIYAKLKAKNPSTAAMGNGAISCYLSNLTQQSIYVMGKVCSEDAGNANNLNNYAALLTNHGVEQGAIPILNYLNKKYARDPVIISNLSLAWMGLGELKMAEKYADSVIRFFPGNKAQVHYVKAVVKESAGDRQGAIEELKQSIGEIYSAEKATLLRKMGGKLTAADHKKKLPADALGLSKFNFPSLPRSYEAAINSKQQWESFYNKLEKSISEQSIKTERLKKEYDAKMTADAKATANFTKPQPGKLVYAFAFNNNTNQSWNNFYQELQEEFVKKEEALFEEATLLAEKNKKMKDELDTIVKVQLAKRFEQDAAGKNFTDAEACNAHKEAYDNYMEPINNLYQKHYTSYIDHKRKMTNELVYAAKQFMDKEYYEYYASNAKLQFLYALQSVSYQIPNYALGLPYAQACINVKTNTFTNTGLAKWEDVHCQPDWKVNLGTASVSTHCNKITLTADILIGEASYTSDVVTGEWTNFTLEVGREIGSKQVGAVEVSAGGKAYIEIDRQGVSEFGVKGSAGVSTGVTTAELEGKLSLMSGKASFETKGGTALDKVVIIYK